jgi:hypothetical protein
MSKPTDIPEGHRWCPKCERILPGSAFGRDNTRANGFRSKCRKCDNSRRSARKKRGYWTPTRIEAAAARAAAIIERVEALRSEAS